MENISTLFSLISEFTFLQTLGVLMIPLLALLAIYELVLVSREQKLKL